MGAVSQSMVGVTIRMETALGAMDVDGLSETMDKFERQFEDLDVKSAYMQDSMKATMATSTPNDQVDDLINMVADENRLDLGAEFVEAGLVSNNAPDSREDKAVTENGDLAARLTNLHR
eukprot:CAMPEP_0195529868 /NCGR_PEP_ID=MMETSP0794_2-20130614/32513_1 /TAXON_ID=515487 /ORGANISM="Stephanopyxis turris, Strain CCMP 815" /LENGTH=118 /DNA_ID=CAMNT_0040661243 /DNA_START=1 /DNA_END=357 /DNA_ORIENTATION=+